MHDREPSSALDDPLGPGHAVPRGTSRGHAHAPPEPPVDTAEAPADADAFGPHGQVCRLVQAVGVDAALAGFISWLAHQRAERPERPPVTALPMITRRRCHRIVERFLRWHHCHETGLGLPYGGDGGVAAYYAALRQSGAGEAELAQTRRALDLLAEYADTGHPYWRWTP